MIEGTFFIEAQGNNEKLVENSLKNLIEKLKNEAKVEVKKEYFDKVIKEEENFSAMVEVDLEMADLGAYVDTAIKYGPSAIQIFGPNELTISSRDFLNVIGKIIEITKTLYERTGTKFKFTKSRDPPKVGLDEDYIEELLEGGAIRAKVVIEVDTTSRKKAVSDFLNAVHSDTLYINKVKTKQVEKGKEFMGVVGLDVLIPDVKTIVDIAIKHNPVLIEIVEPEKIKMTMLDLQDIGLDIAGVLFEMSCAVANARNS
jgi:hypothetical protein